MNGSVRCLSCLTVCVSFILTGTLPVRSADGDTVRGIVKAEAEATISTELVNRQRVTIHDRRRKLTPIAGAYAAALRSAAPSPAMETQSSMGVKIERRLGVSVGCRLTPDKPNAFRVERVAVAMVRLELAG
ncbi:MAG: hypothetical protein ACI9XZ_002615 [Alphaproteobacteria bacterium]|jgi:hypothetical protein